MLALLLRGCRQARTRSVAPSRALSGRLRVLEQSSAISVIKCFSLLALLLWHARDDLYVCVRAVGRGRGRGAHSRFLVACVFCECELSV